MRKLLRSSKYEEEVSDGQLGINERELNSMNKHIPALKGYNGKVATFRQHYYPEGGWGWVITICGFLVQMYTTGLQFSFGVLYLRILKIFATENIIFTGFIGTGCIAVSFGLSPVIVAFCRRKSTRLTAVMGGLVMSLALLFASFATQLHQVLLSYGIIFGIGCGLVRETSVLMLSQYFKRKRELVEILSSLGQGFGIIVFSNIIDILIEYVGWRFGLQIITGLVCGLFFLGMFYRSASLYHPQRRAILHLKDMSKKKGKDKSKIDNKPAYFDFTTLHVSSLQVIILSTILTSAGAYTPFITLILILRGEDLVERYVELNSYLGVGIILGVSTFGLIIISRSAQCVIPTIYLLKTAVFGLGGSLVTLTVVQGYYGYLLFVVLYGFFLGGYHYVLKVYTYECIRAKHFPRAWSFVQGSKSFPMLVGIPISQLINQSTGNPKAGFYLSFSLVFLGALVLFLVNSRKHKRDHVCKKESGWRAGSGVGVPLSGVGGVGGGEEMGMNSMKNIIIQPELSSQRISEVQSEHHSLQCICPAVVKDTEKGGVSQNNNNSKLLFPPQIQIDEDDENYHFHGKNEILSNISEEHLLNQLIDVDYLGECITSCNKVEKYLMYSEYEQNMNSDDFSFSSSNAHSEQISAPVNKKKHSQGLGAHSFSEPNIFRLTSRMILKQPEGDNDGSGQEENKKTWHRLRTKTRFLRGEDLPVISEVGSIDVE
ncbi:monocarboxylate transporter 10 [Eurytemora carolleeae]|uniref:monocarboxylate transporter 10 n=1 Tax=Eurytemora carolleeae TaxID=1294199 RepID=UPI000C780F7B|nr:monocarboxylate transporter 10 [Eurytemora carolleeae]|eukprot:XP_023345981.1 monocarboxylate transporter 10-like [Eurytemora affinis]